jgi:hypothetical protein
MSTRPPVPINRYCERLGLAVPNLSGAARNPETRLVHLLALALLEAGGPLSLDAVVGRLRQLDLPPRLVPADLAAALLKAWHGQPPVVRDAVEGLFYLDLLSDRDVKLIARLGEPPGPPASPGGGEALPQPPDDVPLSEAEVEAAFRGRGLFGYSSTRRAAAIVEASGGASLHLDDINRRLQALAGANAPISDRTAEAWRSDLVSMGPDREVRLAASSTQLSAMRRDVRRMASAMLRRQAESARARAWRAGYRVRRAAEARREMDEARRARRALLHLVSVGGTPQGAAVIDVAARSLRLFVGEQLGELAAHLETLDFLAGLDLRPSLRRLGLDPDRWWLAELRPTGRTFRPSDQGAAIRVDLSDVVRATTGQRGVPAGRDTWETLEAGSRRWTTRLADEAQALHALYEYGALHGGVRARAGRAGDHLLPVAWSLPGDPDLRTTIDAAVRHWAPIEIVTRRASGLEDPWQDAVRADVLERDRGLLVFRIGDRVHLTDAADIRAIRIPDATAAASVRPASDFSLDDRLVVLRVTLDGIDPPIWRRLAVPAFISLARLHGVLQAAFGWTDSHLHQFDFGGERVAIPHDPETFTEGQITRSARIVHVGDVVDLRFRRFTYEYDFGDSWRHTIEIEDVRDDADAETRCLDGARSAPPEDCGGPPGYAHMLEILFDPRHPEFDETREWVGRGFAPERFDLSAVNAALASLAPRW